MQPYSYRPGKHLYTDSLEAEIGGYGGEEAREVAKPRNHRPARSLRNTEEAVIAEQRRNQQRIDNARARQQALANTRQSRRDNSRRVSRERTARREDDELYEDEDIYSQRPPRSAIRWQPNGTNGVDITYASPPPPPNQKHAIPPRRSQQYQLPPIPQQELESDTKDIDEEVGRPGYRRRTPPWYLLLAVGAVIALILWIGGAWINKWWTDTQNDWTYTQAFRTFSVDATVGHNHDSASHPSHFIVQNDNRHIVIIELPANDVSKALIYSAPTLIGDGQEKTPVTITFQVNLQTGLMDMVLHVENQTYIFTNNGVKFVTPQG